jgi:arginyl-tRNA synthetase
MLQNDITDAIKKALNTIEVQQNLPFVVERPQHMAHGDYATNVALLAAPLLKESPRVIAEKLCSALKAQQLTSIEKIEIAENGFINFFVSSDALIQEVEKIILDTDWGKNSDYKDKTVLVEYTDPNPFKAFHIGHLMSNAIGESIARILSYSGAKVLRANYQGDVGLHVAKDIWGYRNLPSSEIFPNDITKWGAAYTFGSNQYEDNPEIKHEIDVLGKEIFDHASDIPEYVEGRKTSLEHFEELYTILGTKFDFYFFESDTGPLGLKLVLKHPELFIESEGAIIFQGELYGLHTRVFVNKFGLPTYEAKDLGLIELKQKACNFDISITITAAEQLEYFKVVLTAARSIFPWIGEKYLHRTHGMMRFTSGKMSSRKGNIITGESLLNDLQEAAKAKMADHAVAQENIAEEVAVGAIKYAVLKQHSGKDILFDPDKSLSLEGDSGPYLQYAHTRAVSLMNVAAAAGIVEGTTDAPTTPGVLERTLIHFPEVVDRCAEELEPHYITTYLTELASSFNAWYAHERVVGGTYPSYGLLLAHATEFVMKQGLSLLGISAPEQM